MAQLAFYFEHSEIFVDTPTPEVTADALNLALVGAISAEPLRGNHAYPLPLWKRATDLIVASLALLFFAL